MAVASIPPKRATRVTAAGDSIGRLLHCTSLTGKRASHAVTCHEEYMCKAADSEVKKLKKSLQRLEPNGGC